MKINDVTRSTINAYESNGLRSNDNTKGAARKEKNQKIQNQQAAPIKSDLLMQTLDLLENSKQIDNNHPLDRKEAGPIETFPEALMELRSLKNSDFASQALGAQANINPQDVLSLFMN